MVLLPAVALVFFLLGFVAHRSAWHDWIRPYLIYFLGRASGCSLSVVRTFKNERFRKLRTDFEKRSKLLKATEEGLDLWASPRGCFWIPRGMSSFSHVLAEQELQIYGSGEFAVRTGDIVIDCGANVGVFTAVALAAGAQLVAAVEPGPQKVECLKRNFAPAIGAGRVIVYPKDPKGVWHEEATLEMFAYQNPVLDSFVKKNQSAESLPARQLPVTTIDNIVRELHLPRVDFIKMDLEGADRHALRGAQATLAAYHPRLAISTEDLDDDYLVVPGLVRQAWSGYRASCGQCGLSGRFRIVPHVLYLS